MTDRSRGWAMGDMADVSQLFVDTIDHLVVPEPGPVVVLDDQPGERRRRPRFVAAAAAVVMVLVAVVGVFTPAGRALVDWLGIGATSIVVDPSTSPEALSDLPRVDRPEGLGRRVVTDLNPLPRLGEPQVFERPDFGRSYLWTEAGSILLSVRAADKPVVSKAVPGAGSPEEPEETEEVVSVVMIDGRLGSGRWISEPHRVELVGGESLLSGPVLIWVEGNIELRLEGLAGLDQATALLSEIEIGTELLAAG